MSNFAPKRTNYDTGDRRWLRDPHKAETHGVTVTSADVADDSDGFVKSGSPVAGEGLVVNDFTIKAGEQHLIAVVHAGTVDRRYLPAPVTEGEFGQVTFINGTAPSQEG